MRRALLALAAATLALALAPAAHAVPYGLEEFDVAFTGAPPPETVPGTLGPEVSAAGAHPGQMVISMRFRYEENEAGGVTLEEAPRDIIVDQVEGFVGAPTAVPTCPAADFLTQSELGAGPVPDCPAASAVGIVGVQLANKLAAPEPSYGAAYNLVPPPGVAAKLGFWILGVPVTVELGVRRSPPYNVTGGPTNISRVLEVLSSKFVIWGNPADPDHDEIRATCMAIATGMPTGEECPAEVQEVPFLTLPRACEGPLPTRYATDSWQDPGAFSPGGEPDLADPAWETGFALTHDEAGNPQGMSGCGALAFSPTARLAPSSAAAESPAGLELEIDVSDEGLLDPAGRAEADIAALDLAFPAGMTLNPSAAEGLGFCTTAQLAAATPTDPGCPGAARLGEIEAETPILDNHTLHGALFLARPNEPATPGKENPFDSLAAVYVVVRDPGLGILVTLATEVTTDPLTGRILATTTDLPPFPLSRVRLSLRGGPRAPLITPPLCGTYTAHATLHPSSGKAPLSQPSAFQITSGPGGAPCTPGGQAPFRPTFAAGTASNAAGHYSPFAMRITRRDGDQDLTRLSATLAPGLVGRVAGIPPCPEGAIAAARAKSGRAELAVPSCPAASRIGTVLAGAGVGSALTYVRGSLYLAGPYNDTPLSIVAIVPAVAGPFDVGTVITRFALRLNPDDGRVEVDGAASDPIPHILEGIPLKLRDLRAYVDRPGLTLNATGCEPEATQATLWASGANPLWGGDDIPLAAAARYQAASCASLGFRPRLSLSLKGKTRRAANTALRAVLRPRAGDANLKGAVVVLPPSQFIDNAHISSPCTRVQYAADACPRSSILGRARAFSPLLDAPLEGPVYFRSNGGERKLPDVVAALRGQFDYDLVIAILQAKNNRVRTKVLNAPDAPVSRFVLRMAGGRKGLLENSENLCSRKQRAAFHLTGHNGARHKTRPVIKTSCKQKKKRKGTRSRHLRR